MSGFDLSNFPTSPSGKRMISYVTAGFYDDSYVGKWIYQIMGLEYDEARAFIEGFADQLFPESATWGLMYHEIKWGLPVRDDLSIEARRLLIQQKRDTRSSMTPYIMGKLLSEPAGCEVQVSDVHDGGEEGYIPEHPNRFRILIKSEGGEVDVGAVVKKAEQIKQSHTTFEYRVACHARVTVGITRTAYKVLFPITGLYPEVQTAFARGQDTVLVDREVGNTAAADVSVRTLKAYYPLCGEEVRL